MRQSNWKHVLVCLLALITAFSLSACGAKEEEVPEKTPIPEATEVPATPVPTHTPAPTATPEPVTAKIMKESEAVEALDAQTGSVFQLSAIMSDGTTGGTWESSNPAAAAVDANGVVSCLKKGETTISYTLGEVRAACKLTVTETELAIFYGGAAKSDITLNGLWGYTIHLEAVVKPAEAEYSWSVDDKSIASVSETGLVTALKEGSTNIRLRSGTSTATCILRVIGTPPGAPANVPAAATPDPNDTTPRIVITFWGSPNSDFTVNAGASVDMDYVLYNVTGTPEVTWSIEEPEYASVDANGVVTGIKSTKDKEKPYTKLIATCGELKCEAVVRVA